MGETRGPGRFGLPTLAAVSPGTPLPTPAALAGELGVDRVVNLSLNEGPHGPFPAALEAIARATTGLNRYPSRGSADLTDALAARLGVTADEVFVAAGADAVIGYVSQAALAPGDEVVVPWPSFPSFVRDAQKRGARPVTVPLRDGVIEIDAVLAAVTSRTRLVFVATPNNPTGLALAPTALRELVEALPAHVLPVADEAYVEYLEPGAGDAVADLHVQGRRILAIRTFSKMYGLAGLRVGYGVGPPDVVDALRRVQRSYDVNAVAQAAALASLDDPAEVDRRRGLNREALALLEQTLVAHGLDPLPGSVANFALAHVGPDADALAAALRAQGVIVQPGAPFGAPEELRITAGTADETAALARALGATGRSARA
ncbi:MAG: pyridoxal phosphate-dependent aminotransferase [Gaiella sp.]